MSRKKPQTADDIARDTTERLSVANVAKVGPLEVSGEKSPSARHQVCSRDGAIKNATVSTLLTCTPERQASQVLMGKGLRFSGGVPAYCG